MNKTITEEDWDKLIPPSPKLLKLRKQYEKVTTQEKEIFNNIEEPKYNQKFWSEVWPKIIDRIYDLHDAILTESIKIQDERRREHVQEMKRRENGNQWPVRYK